MSQPFYNIKMNTKSIVSKSLLFVSLLIFFLFAIYVLYINRVVLYTAQDRSEFLIGSPFFSTLMMKPFGLIQYVAAWLTQFLYKPFVGASLLVAIWALIFFVGIKAFRLKGSAFALMLLPIACLLTSLVDLGYWIYEFMIRGYWFSQSVGYLMMLTLLWGARSTSRKWHVFWYILGFCLYPILGWFALLFILCLALSDKLTWREFLGLLLVVSAAVVWRALLYSNIKFDDVIFAGLPKFETASDKSDYLSIPFWIIGVLSILYVTLSRYLDKWFVPVLCVIAGIAFTWSLMYQDKNYINEMRMARSAEADNWKEVLEIYSETSKPTISMLMLKNVALMNEGGILDRSFKMGNDFIPIYNPDSVHISFLEIASSVSYYNYGMINEGFRLTFECAEQAGFSPLYLRMLCRSAYANGEKELVERFTKLIHGHPYYADWKPSPVSKKVRELQKCYSDELTGVENSDRYIMNSISLWTESDSKLASEQALFYSMMRCDSRRFWKSLRSFLKCHQGEEFPLHAQEAYIMYMEKAPEKKRVMLPVGQVTYDRYKKFWTILENHVNSGLDRETTAEKMRSEFGDTYWFYNIFARKFL